jgi:hypothetical protein
MLDVHPPHHAAATWRDFLIHLATITIGLLIAIGLEQSLEALSRLHQRHELERELHDETSRNLEHSRDETQYFGDRIPILGRRLVLIQTALSGKSALSANVPPLPPAKMYTRHRRPDTAVWDNASRNGTSALLPEVLAQLYTDDYHSAEEAALASAEISKNATDMAALRRSIPGQTSSAGDLDLKQLSPAQLQQYLDLEQKEYSLTRFAYVQWSFLRHGTDCLLSGPASIAEHTECTRKKRAEDGPVPF